MRENSDPHEGHEEPVPPSAETAAGGHAPPGFTDSGNVPPAAAGPAAAELPAARRRSAIIWLLAGAMAIVAALTALAVVRKLQADHALSRVARVAAMPAADVVARDFPLAGVDDTTADAAGATGAAALLAQPAPAEASAVRQAGTAAPDKDATPGSVDRPGGADPAAAEPRTAATTGMQASQAIPPATADAEGRAGSGAEMPAAAGSAATTATVAKNRAVKSGVANDGQAKRGAAGAGDTFKRCPPLGKKGAVMCRWHICNGAAGKEAACRPYLERAP